MKFVQHDDGSCDIKFSWKERLIFFRKGKLHLSSEHLRHFGNNLVKIVADWQINFNKDLANKETKLEDKIEGK